MANKPAHLQGTITLSELKKINEEEEKKASKKPVEEEEDDDPILEESEDDADAGDDPEVDDDSGSDEDPETDDDAGEDEVDDPADPDDDDTEGKDKKSKPAGKPEDWMLDDEGKPPKAVAKFTDADAAAIRKKYKGQLEELRRENEELKKKGGTTTAAPKPDTSDLKEPKRDQFKTDLEYLEARQDYRDTIKERERMAQYQAQQIDTKKQELERKRNEAVDNHYVRADKLVKTAGIDPDRYKAADEIVRRAINQAFPGAGDAVTDQLIARMGEGSEKVIFNLGVNSKRRQELVDLLIDDDSGLSAAAFLGRLNGSLNPPKGKVSSAPKPPPKVQGDGGPVSSSSAKAKELKLSYNQHHRNRNTQGAWKIKKKAKDLGIDTSDW